MIYSKILSLGDCIDLGLNFDRILFESSFNQHFQSDFIIVILIVMTKLITLFPDLIEKFKLDQKRLKRD